MKIKFFFLFLFTEVCVGVLFFVVWNQSVFDGYSEPVLEIVDNTSSDTSLIEIKKTNEPNTIMLVGDLMLGRGVARIVEKNGGNFDYIFENVNSLLSSADITFGNLEGPVSDDGFDSGKKYSFRFKPVIVDSLARVGFDVVSLANNHIFDWGRKALCDTLVHLQKVNITSVGAGCNKQQANEPFVVTIGEGLSVTTIAFVAYTEFYKGAEATEKRAGITKWDIPEILETIKDLKNKGIDLVFLSVHWGTEYKEISNEAQQLIARSLVDGGVDVVVGHHPHVVQEIERYNNGLIVYSLGNFIFDQSWSEATMRGLAVEVQVIEGRIVGVQEIPIQLNRSFQPMVVGTKNKFLIEETSI